MAKYVLIYQAPGGAAMGATPEEQEASMKVWTDWFGSLNGALVDGGNPATRTRTISSDGSVRDEANGPTGYSIIQAGSLDEAVRLAKGCPVLLGPGNSVQVVETIDM
jgi:hypothetical protein